MSFKLSIINIVISPIPLIFQINTEKVKLQICKHLDKENYRENPLFRQSLSRDNMSDRSECRNIESVT